MVTIAGIISTIVGNGIAGYSGDGGNATAAELYDPCRVTLDATGNIYICDEKNNLIRKVNNIGQAGIPQFGIQNSEFRIYPNPTTTILNVVLRQAQDDNAILVITDMLGNNIKQIPFNTQQVILNLGDLADGIYFITIETERGKTIKKIIKQ
jgi:DNA-binding beta-propeller fold protein YncE